MAGPFCCCTAADMPAGESVEALLAVVSWWSALFSATGGGCEQTDQHVEGGCRLVDADAVADADADASRRARASPGGAAGGRERPLLRCQRRGTRAGVQKCSDCEVEQRGNWDAARVRVMVKQRAAGDGAGARTAGVWHGCEE